MIFGQSSSLEKIAEWAKGQRLHDYSLPTMLTYKQLSTIIQKSADEIRDDILLLTPSSKKKTAYFKEMPSKDALKDYMSKDYTCVLPEKHPELSGASKRVEVEYNLAQLFDPASYPNAKKRHQRIKYPFSFLEKEGIVVRKIELEDLPDALELHEKWIAMKLADPKVHRISLSTARYRRCVELAFEHDCIQAYVARGKDDQLMAVRVFGIERQRSFDLAYYSDYPNMKSQLTEYLNVAFMKKLVEQGVLTLNAGLSSDKGLKQFKDHFPNEKVYSYQYKQAKEV